LLDIGAPGRQRGARKVNVLPTLLLIDDEPELSRLIAYAGEVAGYQPTATGDTASFKRAYEDAGADLVAIDLGLPHEDGVELLRYLAEQGCTAPILIVSGFDRRVLETAQRLGEALGLEMVGHVEKPIRLTALENLLDDIRKRTEA
jgi:DNA-binding response OmpR family regulator